MDAGVLQLHVFADDPSYEPMRVLEGETISPSLLPDSEVSASADVSLIVPTCYSRQQKSDALRRQLDGVTKCNCIREIVLVAADGNVDALEPYRDLVSPIPVKIIVAPPEQRAESRNIGAESASSPYLLYLDDDMLPQDWRSIDVILSSMLEQDRDCALFPRRHYAKFPLLYDEAKLDQTIERWRENDPELSEDLILDPIRDGGSWKTMTFCFPGCFMLISAEAFKRIGGFPSGFVGWGFEDSDFAIRAVCGLRVLNLFRTATPLLHIDHPVSPYKTEEYRRNLQHFNQAFTTADMDWLCQNVFAGEDFDGNLPLTSQDELMRPIQEAMEDHPVDVSPWEWMRCYEHAVENRVQRGLDATPEYVLLHGSRGVGTHSAKSDHDVLVLFRGGGFAEHYVCGDDNYSVESVLYDEAPSTQDRSRLMEMEFAGVSKYQHHAAAPVAYTARSPLEIAKIAEARVLWGDQESFEIWQEEVVGIAVQVGLPVWLLYVVGSKAIHGSDTPLQRYMDSICKIMGTKNAECAEQLVRERAQMRETEPIENDPISASSVDHEKAATGMPLQIGATTSNEATSVLVENPTSADPYSWDESLFEPENFLDLVRFTRMRMDRDLPGWRTDMADNKRVFATQIPELWHALRLLLANERNGSKTPSR
ncbi:MAG: galactosyltransferase-related protein [Planctomycetota bacterium]